MVQLIFKSGPKNGSAIPLGRGLVRIGRNPANDIQIEEPSVSGFHCELLVSPVGVAFRDVGSRNGSFIEGRRVEKELISSAKMLRLGGIDMEVHVPPAHVAIPERKKEAEVFAHFMPDGTPACQTHAGVCANFQCLKCEKRWCPECVRRTGLVGSSNATYSCTECGGKCVKAEVVFRPEKKSLFDHLSNMILKFRN